MGGFDVSGGEAFSFTDGEPLVRTVTTPSPMVSELWRRSSQRWPCPQSPIAAGNISVAETAGRSPAEGGRLHRNTAKVLQYLDRAIEAAEGVRRCFEWATPAATDATGSCVAGLRLLPALARPRRQPRQCLPRLPAAAGAQDPPRARRQAGRAVRAHPRLARGAYPLRCRPTFRPSPDPSPSPQDNFQHLRTMATHA